MTERIKAVLVRGPNLSRAWLDAITAIPELAVVGLVNLESEADLDVSEWGSDVLVSSDLTLTLEKTRPDVVFDCSATEDHVHVTLEALKHGCHVLGEPPMADTIEHARQMLAAARAADKLYAVLQSHHYEPGVRRLKTFLASGQIGRITTVHSDFYIDACLDDLHEHRQHVLLMDMAIHTFDVARLLSGVDPVSVYCKEWDPVGVQGDHKASAVAVFTMTEGVVYTYRGSWCAEGLQTSHLGEWRIIGDRGSVKWDGKDNFRAEVLVETGESSSQIQAVDIPPFNGPVDLSSRARAIQEFVRCIYVGDTPGTVCMDNIKSLEMVFGAVNSAKLERPLGISGYRTCQEKPG